MQMIYCFDASGLTNNAAWVLEDVLSARATFGYRKSNASCWSSLYHGNSLLGEVHPQDL